MDVFAYLEKLTVRMASYKEEDPEIYNTLKQHYIKAYEQYKEKIESANDHPIIDTLKETYKELKELK